MYKKIVLIAVVVFLLGWISGSVYSSYFDKDNYETGLNQDEIAEDKNIDAIREFERIEKLFAEEDMENKDKNSPYDWVKQEQIFVYDDQVVIKLQNPEWAMFTDTNSMDPVIDSTSNAIELIPKSEDDIHMGDIVAYKSKYRDGIITHRVADIGHDAFGWYARLKGDNNEEMDPGKVRFGQIKRIIVAIIY